jgi:hypothetical protein
MPVSSDTRVRSEGCAAAPLSLARARAVARRAVSCSVGPASEPGLLEKEPPLLLLLFPLPRVLREPEHLLEEGKQRAVLECRPSARRECQGRRAVRAGVETGGGKLLFVKSLGEGGHGGVVVCKVAGRGGSREGVRVLLHRLGEVHNLSAQSSAARQRAARLWPGPLRGCQGAGAHLDDLVLGERADGTDLCAQGL